MLLKVDLDYNMPLLKILPSLISQGSFTGSFSGTSSYARRSLTASYALNASGGGSTLRTGSTYPITSSYARKSITASYLNTVSQSLIPAKNNTYSLGTSTKKWKDIYVSTASIYFDNYPLRVAVKNNSPQLLFNTSSIVTVPSGSNPSTSSYARRSLTASYALNATGGGGSTLRTGSTYPITSSYARRAITASYALNGSGGGSTWAASGLTSNITSSTVAAFNSSGLPILVTPSSNNTYLVYQNGVLRWIPIISAAITLSNFQASNITEIDSVNSQNISANVVITPSNFQVSNITEIDSVENLKVNATISVSLVNTVTSSSI
jgi:hypothetical protein